MLARLARPVASLLLTAALIAFVLLALGASPLLVFGALWEGAFGNWLAATALGIALDGWPRPLAVALVLAGGALGGALWSAVCGWLRERRDVSEVISTIMLNFVAAQLLSYAVHGPLMEPSRSYPKSAPIARAAELWMFAAAGGGGDA